MRIGVIGGTFDPIHVGHLILAEEARGRLGLEQVLFVPAGLPPHKVGREITPPERRVEMVRLAIADNEHFALSRVDVDRPGPCYTVDTIRILRDAWGHKAEIYFLMGGDSLLELPTWRHPDLLLRMCHVVALGRPGYRAEMADLERILPAIAFAIRILDAPRVDVSATAIRQRVRAGRSIRYLVPPPVEQYIYRHRLYI